MKYPIFLSLRSTSAFLSLLSFLLILFISSPVQGQWTEEQKIFAQLPSGTDFFTNENDQMGRSVSVDGDYALVGVPFADINGSNSGMAFLYFWDGTNWTEEQVLTPTDGAANDNFGYSVSISGTTALIGAYRDGFGTTTQAGSAYVFEKSGSTWSQTAKLTAGDAASNDFFGHSVSISGTTALIGAYLDDFGSKTNAGSAYVFEKSGSTWTQTAKLTASDAATGDYFGSSVSISGNTVLVGAWLDDIGSSFFGSTINAGSAYVFEKSGSTWNQTTKLTASDLAQSDYFGRSVSISGTTALVGAYSDDFGSTNDAGSAYVFEKSGSTWSQTAKLTAGDAASSDNFGFSVSISGTTALVGAYRDDFGSTTDAGSAYVFEKSGSTWSQTAKLTAGDAASFDNFGLSVSISGTTALIGAIGDDDNGSSSGSAYMFDNTGSGWSQTEKLNPSSGGGGNQFGYTVAISGNMAIVGVPFDDEGGNNAGSAYVFEKDGSGNWNETAKLTANDAASSDWFGYSVSISGTTALVGAYLDDFGTTNDAGSAYVFEKSGSTWSQTAKLTAGDAASSDNFGFSVSVSGNTALVGAYSDDFGTTTDAGSAYIFEKSGSTWSQTAKLTAGDAASSDLFGSSVSISGNTALVGAYRDDFGSTTDAGSAYVFEKSGSTWSQTAKLSAGDAASSDRFGFFVSISGNSALVGAYLDDFGTTTDAGSAYIFEKSGSTWSQTAKLTAGDAASSDLFGRSVSISGTTALVGAYADDFGSTTDAGSAYVFEKSGSTWSQTAKLTPNDGAADDWFGYSVSISGTTALIGARLDNGNLGSNVGSAYFFSGLDCTSETEVPVITACPSDQNVACPDDIPAPDISLVTATDDCTVTITHEGDVSDGLVPPTITRTYRASDEAGNFSECTQTFTVEDDELPTLACPSAITEVVTGGASSLVVNYPAPTTSDNCGNVTVTSVPASGSSFAVGTTSVLVTATDDAGNEATCTFDVTIVPDFDGDGDPDSTDPCPTNAFAFLDDCGVCVGGDTGLDPCASADLVLTPSASSVTQCEEFTVLVSVETDDTYNLVEAQINFDPAALQAIDVTAPDGSNVFTANPPFDQPGSPVTQDNTNGFVAYTAGATTDITGSTDFIRITFEVIGTGGTTSITPITTGSPRSRIVFSDFVGGIPVATDILNEALEIDFTLNPDMEDPTFTCISAPSRNTDPGVCTYTAQGTEFDPTGVSDNCEVATISNNINGSATLDGVVFNGGENVIWTVTDVNGNDATCTFTIGVVDNENPTISCPADQTVSVDASCQAVMPDYTNLATANDNCSVVVTQSPAAGTALNIGTTEVTLTATDPSNNDADCSFNVVVIDDEVPTLTCPDDITVELSTAPDPFVTGMATGSDNCGFTISYEDDDSGLTGCSGTGVLVRTFTITDDSGNAVSCPQNITIQDTEAPEAPICPADISQSVDAGECSAVVNFSAPGSVLDNKYVEDFENPDFVSGDGLPFLGWNNYGSDLSRVVTGTNGIASPDGVAHARIDTNNSAGFTGAFSRLGGYSAAFGEGYRAQADVYIDLSDPGVSSDTYGWDLSVASSNQDTSHLRDFIFHAASNAAGNVLIGGSNNTNFTRRNDIATLNHYEITTSGWYTFEWVFRDNGSDVLAVDLNLIDDAGTVLWTETRSNPADVISTIVGGNRYMWFTFLEVETLALDDVRLQRNVATTCDAADGDTFNVGTTTITCNATDACDNSASCSFEVTVTDDEVPTLTCPDDITVELSTAPDPFVTGMATGSDNCGFTISYDDDDSGLTGCNGTGVLVRTFTITDDSGNAVSCPQNITIQDTEAPEAPICPADISQSVDAGECSAVVNFSAPGSVLDNKYVEDFENPDFVSGDGLPFLGWNNYGSDLSRVVTGTNGITSPDGVAHARIDTNNSAGFTGAFSRLGGYSAAFGEGYRAQADVYIDLSDPGVSSDTYGWDLSVASSNQDTSHLRDFIFHAASNAAGNVLIGGSNNTNFTRRNDIATLNHYEITTSGWYTFEWVFRDNGSDVLAVDLNLIDDAGTVLWTETRSNPADVISTIVGGNRYMWFTFLEVETLAIDDVRVQRNVATTCDAADGDTFNVGTTTITCNATDACDNAASCSFEVTVTDDELPTIACPGPQTASSDANCQVALADYTSLATAGDNCSFEVTQSPAPGTLVGLGTTAVTLTVADASNNEADCSFDVVVTDDTDPILTCPTDIIVSNDPNQCGAVVSFAATATDNCAASPTITYSPSSGSTFQVGTTTVTVTADDGNENTSTCTFTVTVNDTEDPVITCAGDATVTINQTNDTYLASGGEFDPTSVSDNCPGVTVSHDASLQPGTSGTDTESLDGWEFPVGTTTITFTATDVAGNTTDCVVIVTVENAVVTGTLVLNTLCLERDMKVTIYETGTAILAGTFNGVLIDSNGDFSFVATGITPGNYDVYLKPEDYLTKMVEDVTIGSTPATISATAFAPGDIDAAEDDQINGNDLSLIIGAYNTEDGIDAAYNSEADINCDGFVDALDLSLLIFFFFDEGDSPN